MKGVVLTIAIDGIIAMKDVDGPPSLALLKEGIGGGPIELVPYFDTILIGKDLKKCRTFVDEQGKLKGLPPNPSANALWKEACNRHRITIKDFLVGQVCVVWGDAAWMRAL
jgi:hypothetical protein